MKNTFQNIAVLLTFLIGFPAVADDFVPVCERTIQIRNQLENLYQTHCEHIGKEDLWTTISLDLSSRKIVELKSGDFSGFVNLRRLDISFNALITLPEGIFNDLKNLNRLEMQMNPLEHLSSKTFQGLDRVTHLLMFGTQLTEIKVGTFDPLLNLQILRLDMASKLERIPDYAFLQNSKIRKVDVGSAPLTQTGGAAFAGVPEVSGLPATFNVDPEFSWEQ